MMTSNGSTQILHEGISMWIPKGWDYNIDTYDEAEGSKAHCLSMAARGKDTRSIDISWGPFLTAAMHTHRPVQHMKRSSANGI